MGLNILDLPDLRRQRATQLTAALMQELDDIIPDDQRRETYDRLMGLFYENGAALLTDQDREWLGLERRDALGWTPSERLLRKKQELDLLHVAMAASFHFGKP